MIYIMEKNYNNKKFIIDRNTEVKRNVADISAEITILKTKTLGHKVGCKCFYCCKKSKIVEDSNMGNEDVIVKYSNIEIKTREHKKPLLKLRNYLLKIL